mmetsp:Transcript_9153/g.10362  ORF Transcript_9153/g.10362 Transcript_9153/m.10362 type:complete len:208 (-) Transcript_9153:184-807(-)
MNRKGKVDKAVSNIGSEEEQVEDAEKEEDIEEPGYCESMQHYRTPYIWLMIVLSAAFPFFMAGNFKTYEMIDIPDDRFITIVGSIGAVVNGLSRTCWSTMQDIYGFKRVYMALVIIEMLLAFSLDIIHKVKFLYLIWAMLTFACLGGHFSMFPTLCAKIYGPVAGGRVYASIFFAYSTTILINVIFTKFRTSGYITFSGLFYIEGIF